MAKARCATFSANHLGTEHCQFSRKATRRNVQRSSTQTCLPNGVAQGVGPIAIHKAKPDIAGQEGNYAAINE
jgi:hypothetical protein